MMPVFIYNEIEKSKEANVLLFIFIVLKLAIGLFKSKCTHRNWRTCLTLVHVV